MITRLDLPGLQPSVQAIHAALESAYATHAPDEHPHLVLCAVPDELSLQKELHKLRSRGAEMHPFHEPDRDGELTAIASGVVYDRRPYRHLKLYRSES